MDTTCPQNSTLRIPLPATKRFDSPISPIVAFAQKIGGIFASLNVNLGRKKTLVPGVSDRAFARLSAGELYEDTVRWNALAQHYGGTRTRI